MSYRFKSLANNLFYDFITPIRPLKGRVVIIDLVRIIGVITMIHFHFSYDLKLFRLIDIELSSAFWFTYPRFVATCFLLGSGMSFEYGRLKGQSLSFSRVSQIGFYALLISIGSLILAPGNWIFFGTLHCIAGCLLFALVFLARWPKLLLPIFLGTNIIFLGNIVTYKQMLLLYPIPSFDYIPFYPWILVFLLGMAIMRYSGLSEFRWGTKTGILAGTMAFFSQKSLAIYLVHQPLLIGLAWALHWFSKSVI
jgi:uncharacterized membrane protein